MNNTIYTALLLLGPTENPALMTQAYQKPFTELSLTCD